ncbi:neuraminidase-like domain-containing protein [Nocardia amamiensis]|uniref:Tc toxin subunit A-related protein n=1 Tax=Nocardia amamiensis TaxID=404578 RepID=UPI0033E08F7C
MRDDEAETTRVNVGYVYGRCRGSNGEPQRDLPVRAIYRSADGRDYPIGDARTDDAGRYRISVSPAWTNTLRDPAGFVFVRASRRDTVVAESAITPVSSIDQEINLRLHTDPQKSVGTPNQWRRVFGVVRDEMDRRLSDVTVYAVARDLRAERMLGSAPARDGRYEIRYADTASGPSSSASTNLFIAIVDGGGRELHRSPVHFGVTDDIRVDLCLRREGYRGPSEWETKSERLRTLIGETPPEKIRESEEFGEITFLASQTQWSTLEIATWVASHRLADKAARLQAEIAPEIFFAFLSKGQPGLYQATFRDDFKTPERLDVLDERLLQDVVNLGKTQQLELIEDAVSTNTIPASVRPVTDSTIAAFSWLRRRLLAERSLHTDGATVADLIGLVPAAAGHYDDILGNLAAHRGPVNQMWTNLAERRVLSDDTVRQLQQTFELAAITRNHLPMIKALSSRLQRDQARSLRDFAKLSRSEWTELIASNDDGEPPIGTPTGIDGYTDAQRAQAYAARLSWLFERKYPTTSFAAKLDRATRGGRSIPRASRRVAQFLAQHPDLHLDEHRIDHYLVEHPQAMIQVEAEPELRADLMTVQRVFRLEPTFAAAEALLSNGIESSQQIYQMGEPRFLATMADTAVNTLDAQRIFRRAESTYAGALALFGEYSAAINSVDLAAVPGLEPTEAQIRRIAELPDLQTLFGSQDYCECAHCQSVYSPAAYFVDLLHFLDLRTTRGSGVHANKSVKDVLFERRPDLGAIELSCANTDTALPYIDLVNEVLEGAVDSVDGISTQFVTIEFDLSPIEEGPIDTHLRETLAAAGFPLGKDARVETSPLPDELYIVRDVNSALTLADVDGDTATVRVRKQTFGIESDLRAEPEHVDVIAYDNFLAVSAAHVNLPFNLWDEEARAHLAHLGVPQHSLLTLFQGLDASGRTVPSDTTIARARIGIIDGTLPLAGGADSWMFWGLSEDDNDVPHPDFPDDASKNISGTWVEVLSSVPVFLHRSGLTYPELRQLLDMRFVNPRGGIALADNPTCDTSVGRIDGLVADALSRANGFVRLWRALGCRMWELDNLLAEADATADHIPVTSVALIADCLTVQSATNLDLATVCCLYNGLDVVRYVDRTDGDAHILSVYDRTFRQDSALAKVFPPSLGDLAGPIASCSAALMAALQLTDAALSQLISALGLTQESVLDGEILRQMFALTTVATVAGLTVEDAARLTSLSSIELWVDPPATLAFLEAVGHLNTLELTVPELAGLLIGEATALLLSSYRDARTFIAELRAGYSRIAGDLTASTADAAQPVSPEELQLDQQRLGTQMQLYITEALAGLLALDTLTTASLLDAGTTPLRPVFDVLLANLPDAGAPSAAQVEAVDEAVRRLAQSARVITKLDLRNTDVAWWLADGNAQTMGWPDLLGFPVSTADAAVSFADWAALQGFWAAWRALPITAATAVQFAAALTTPTAPSVEALATMAGWESEDLKLVAATFGWQSTAQAPDRLRISLRDATNLRRVGACMSALRRLGVSAKRVLTWVAGTPPEGAQQSVAADIKQVARSRYSPAQWRQIAQPIQDKLREAKRDALVAYLLTDRDADGTWHDHADLYSHFLIDIDMSPCMATSRLVQATAAVQLFVQRCMLGLENDIRVDATADPRWQQWEWMKNYRVWEANRKVFLYPENWIEPELRDEKSQSFVELERELLQSDVTADTVEQAFATYLEKLDAVANPEIRTWVREDIEQGNAVLHVIGRSRSSGGGDHFYRRHIGGRWTPWERVDLDIGSDHVLIAVDNHRVYLMWPQFIEKSQMPTSVTAPQPGTSQTPAQPTKRWEVRLFRSERIRGRWSPKELVDDIAIIDGWKLDNDVHNIGLHITPGDGISVELATTANPNDWASVSNQSFHKVGRQVKALRSRDNWIFQPALRSKFFNNLIQHDDQLQFGFGKRLQPAPFGSEQPLIQVHDGIKNIHVLSNIPAGIAYTVLASDAGDPGDRGSFFYFDWRRTYFVHYGSSPTFSSTASTPSGQPVVTGEAWSFTFTGHYHPYVDVFTERLLTRGLPGLLNRQIQLDPSKITGIEPFDFLSYEPSEREDAQDSVDGSAVASHVNVEETEIPIEEVDFSYEGPYSAYNWELFFHVPFLIASKLWANQQFDDAMRWFHFIFDPVGGDAIPTSAGATPPTPQQKFWITKPFYLRSTAEYQATRIEEILAGIAGKKPELLRQVAQWRANPFNPHLIARMRTIAYQKNVVMKYVRMLVAWGDSLFSRETRESIGEATQLYILARAILGRRPRQVPSATPRPVRTYNELDALGLTSADPLIDLENLVSTDGSATPVNPADPALPQLNLLYFGLPHNDKLLGLWDLVEDRLAKIRSCRNLAGTVRQLPLFDPPIDPALLVKATAAGLSISEALAETAAPLPQYRFLYTLQQARAAVEEVKALGSALGAAIEKRDAESLLLVRQDLEIGVRRYILQIRQDQIDEALRMSETLTEQRGGTQARLEHYRRLIEGSLSQREKDALDLTQKAMDLETAGTVVSAIAGAMAVIPDFDAGATGAFGSPTAKVKFGGTHLSAALQMTAGVLRGLTNLAQMGAGRASTLSAYARRTEDWTLQQVLAEKELAQIDKQILAAAIRHQMASKEKQSQQLQIEQNEKETEYLRTKFTNTELYDWMVSQCSFVYFQSFQLALDLAKRAERAFRYELGLTDSSYIQGAHWDSLRKGLLAGEGLIYDLRRLESAFHTQHSREYELTKHISLNQLDAPALLRLRRNGQCEFEVPELAFDMDHPGHYFRRIKSVSLSIPCVVGPYTTIGARLSLQTARIRISAELTGGGAGAYAPQPDDPRFREQLASTSAIATSQGQQDDGLFQLDFNDPRYLPFEGAGAISMWQLKINNTPAQFDLDTITDVILHISYTARDGGDVVAEAASAHTLGVLAGAPAPEDGEKQFRVLDLRREFPNEWARFKKTAADEPAILTLGDIGPRLPYYTQELVKSVNHVELAAAISGNADVVARMSGIGTQDVELQLTDAPNLTGLLSGAEQFTPSRLLRSLTLRLPAGAAPIDDLFLIIGYTAG